VKPDAALWLWQAVNEPPADDSTLPPFREALKAYALSYLGTECDDEADAFINEFMRLVLDEESRYISSWLTLPLPRLAAAALTTFRLMVLLPYRLRNRGSVCDTYQQSSGADAVLLTSAECAACQPTCSTHQQRRLDAIRLMPRSWCESYPDEFAACGERRYEAALLTWWEETAPTLMTHSELAELFSLSGGSRAVERLLRKARALRRPRQPEDQPISADSALMAVLKRQITSFFKKS
jgi:hypothetical protein